MQLKAPKATRAIIRCLRASMALVLLPAAWGLSRQADAQPAGAFAQPEPIIRLVSTLPRNEDRKLKQALSLICKSVGAPASSCQLFYTFGDQEVMDKLAARQQAGKGWLIFLDGSGARLMGGRLRWPAIIITPGRPGLAPQQGETWLKDRPYFFLETLPPPEAACEVIGRLHPAPQRVGLVYNQADPCNESFVSGIRAQIMRGPESRPLLIDCQLPPGACRNANEISAVLDKSLSSLSAGDLLLALPGTNTLKFAFLIAAQAERRRLGLITLGDFAAGHALCRIAYAPQALAQACWKVIVRGALPPEAGRIIPPPPGLKPEFDTQVMAALGYQSALAPSVWAGKKMEHPRQ